MDNKTKIRLLSNFFSDGAQPMDRQQKIELLKGIAEGTRNIWETAVIVLLVRKDKRLYLTRGSRIGREITQQELDRIPCPKVIFDSEDFGL